MTVAPYICQFKLKSTLKKEFIMAIQNTSTNTTVPNSAVTPPAAPAQSVLLLPYPAAQQHQPGVHGSGQHPAQCQHKQLPGAAAQNVQALRKRTAMSVAPDRLVSGSNSANSSPPIRPKMSVSRLQRLIVAAISLRTLSPIG